MDSPKEAHNERHIFQGWDYIAEERMAEYARRAAQRRLLSQARGKPNMARGGRGFVQLVSALFKRSQRAPQDAQPIFGEPSSVAAS